MEETRTYRNDEDESRRENDDERAGYSAAPEDEVPFHIPRD
jgi:hypothetical protein